MSETRLVFIRHGESFSNAEGWISGNATCGGLTGRGRAQAEAVRDRLLREGAQPSAVLTSTMPRALQTAEIVAGPLGHAPRQIHELSERHPGECEGLTVDEYRQRYDRHPYEDWMVPMSPGGESSAEFLRRIRGVLDDIIDEFHQRTVLVVCHGGIIMGASELLVEESPGGAGGRFLNPANTAITEWRRRHRAGTPVTDWYLARYNDHAHLLI